ncbi:3-deoxy-7-phosphoheptulonate synthase [Marivirga atlantica]|uniref:3-deoxy-7-phosphoheptulonate synthase n=1 Tax=Marivirga atlantica TaxID=1548457 RepID=A0A937AEI8_9BACT|nr:3-deoxy-7-phosphoheptulonate synthase [Marivirga atlantica]MBL0765059.1 3-deoxy-7-phosphoheptulonate synthase [Marivirga atlantica]
MILQLEKNIAAGEKDQLISSLGQYTKSVSEVQTQKGFYLVALENKDVDIRNIGQLKGVKDVHVVSDNYQLVSKKWKVSPSEISLRDGDVISQNDFALMAGPCSIESEEQVDAVIKHLVENNVKIMRGGVYKPRSSPYSFRGLGMDGLKMWYEKAKAAGIKIITEVMQVSQVEEMYDYIDIYQVGARNTQNFNLLDELGKVDKPVMIKRGVSGTIEELLYSAEYVFSGGNEDLILCERGIRTFENMTRNTLDINAIPVLKDKSHLPVVIDPSHGIGIRKHVEPVALAGIMAGADGVIYELHPDPEKAMSDGQQSLYFEESAAMINKMRKAYALRGELN